MSDTTAKGKPRPALFRALGHNEPPTEISADGQQYVQVNILKHDSWAATGMYCHADDASQKIIAKFNRQQSILGIPMKWLGRILASGEHTIMKVMDDEPTIAHSFDVIAIDGKPVHHVAAHRYIEGHPLTPNDRVSDEFFPTLKAGLEKLHARKIAYVDMNNRGSGLPAFIGGLNDFCRGDRNMGRNFACNPAAGNRGGDDQFFHLRNLFKLSRKEWIQFIKSFWTGITG